VKGSVKWILLIGGIALILAVLPDDLRREDGSIPPVGITATPPTAEGREAVAAPKGVASDQGKMPSSLRGRAFLPPPPRPIPSGNAAEAIDQLKGLASQGDAGARYAIYQVLESCYFQLLRERSSDTLDCKGVGEDDIALRLDHLQAAAEAGDPNAQLQYPVAASAAFLDSTFRPDGERIAANLDEYLRFRERSMAFLHAGASSGNVRAMNAVAEAYSMGLLVGKDPVAAYAYALAAERTGLSPRHTPWVSRLESGLTPQQRARGDQWAREILHSCCGS
jgi:hypothetical protein